MNTRVGELVSEIVKTDIFSNGRYEQEQRLELHMYVGNQN